MLTPVGAEPVLLDRRQRRRRETIEEALAIAAEIMAEHGVAGLSVGELARRMGIRPPSLYVYFPSKIALYDALFARGSKEFSAVVEAAVATLPDDPPNLAAALLPASRAIVQWSLEHPAYSQLIFWRPVPGFEPSPESYQPAVRALDVTRKALTSLQARRLVRADAVIEDAVRDWTILIAGVASQQLANGPGEDPDTGRFVAALPSLVAMFAAHYGAPPTRRPRR